MNLSISMCVAEKGRGGALSLSLSFTSLYKQTLTSVLIVHFICICLSFFLFFLFSHNTIPDDTSKHAVEPSFYGVSLRVSFFFYFSSLVVYFCPCNLIPFGGSITTDGNGVDEGECR